MSGLGTSNSYEILAQLAAGGMAELYLARATGVGGVHRHVVLKRILPAHAGDPGMVTMFLDEARIAAQLRHANIAQFFDVGRLGTGYFYTMEYVHGETVAALIHKASLAKQTIPIPHVLAIAAGTAAGLHHAHTRVGADRKPLRIVHRDVTPPNIMIDFEGAVKLLDFGVAKALNRATSTVAGVIKGKVAYFSPEQLSSAKGADEPIDGRSDVFSLGVCMYEMLVQHYLFQRPTDLATITAIVSEPIAPPSALRRDVPPLLDEVVMKALAKNREQRYASAEALHEALEQVAARLGVSISNSALGRYMRSLFGSRPEPWLDAEALVPVTVVTGEVLKDVEPTMQIPLEPSGAVLGRDSLDLDQLILSVRKVHSPFAFEPTMDEDTLDESESTTIHTSRQHSVALPSAAEHPGWEATIVGIAAGAGSIDTTSRVPVEDFPSHITTVVDPGTETETVPKLPPPPVAMSASSSGRMIVEATRPIDVNRTTPYPRMIPQTPTPRPTTPWPVKPASEARWNVPRLVAAGLVLVALVLLIWFALS